MRPKGNGRADNHSTVGPDERATGTIRATNVWFGDDAGPSDGTEHSLGLRPGQQWGQIQPTPKLPQTFRVTMRDPA
ncbi:hypothetical protein GCM10027089_41240 [Nocardia thraciensis]